MTENPDCVEIGNYDLTDYILAHEIRECNERAIDLRRWQAQAQANKEKAGDRLCVVTIDMILAHEIRECDERAIDLANSQAQVRANKKESADRKANALANANKEQPVDRNNRYFPGKGCKCEAKSAADCGCDVDWRSVREIELEQNALRVDEFVYETAVYCGSSKYWKIFNTNSATVYGKEYDTEEKALADIEEGAIRGGRIVKRLKWAVLRQRLGEPAP